MKTKNIFSDLLQLIYL